MKSSPAHHRTANGHKGLMDVVAFVKTRPQSAELVEQRQCLLHNVTEDSQAAAVWLSTPSDDRGNVAARQLHPMRSRVISSITHYFLGLAQWRTDLAPNRRDRVDQRD